jgi:hypothetical protein
MELISSGGYAEYGSPPSIIYDPFRVEKGRPRARDHRLQPRRVSISAFPQINPT